MPDEIVTEATKELISSGGPWAAIILFMGIALWYVDRRAMNERREYQAALDKSKADHLEDVKKANEQFGPIKDQMAAVVSSNHALLELARDRKR